MLYIPPLILIKPNQKKKLCCTRLVNPMLTSIQLQILTWLSSMRGYFELV